MTSQSTTTKVQRILSWVAISLYVIILLAAIIGTAIQWR